MRRAPSSVLLLCAIVGALSGCAPRTRRDVGTVIAATGGLTAVSGICVAAGSDPVDDDPSSVESAAIEPNPEVGLPLLGIGLAIAIIGGVVYGSGVDMTPPQDPPSEPQQRAKSDYLY